MAKIYVQSTKPILESTASLDTSACISGSVLSEGYSSIVGGIFASASLNGTCPILISQSFDQGENWDQVSTCGNNITPDSGCGWTVPVYGNAVKISIYTEDVTSLSTFRTKWYLRPI